MHSTTVENAKKIMLDGLIAYGMRDIGKGWDVETNPCCPHFGSSLVLLAGPKDKEQSRINMHALAYEYMPGAGNNAKAVFAFPAPSDGKPHYFGNDIDKTFLGQADGSMITREPEGEAWERFRTNPSCSLGYFDFEENVFVYNEAFCL